MASNIQVGGFFFFYHYFSFSPTCFLSIFSYTVCSFCSKYDLYSKSKVRVDVDQVKPYYISLIEKVRLNIPIIFFKTWVVFSCCDHFNAVLPTEAQLVKNSCCRMNDVPGYLSFVLFSWNKQVLCSSPVMLWCDEGYLCIQNFHE